LAPVSTSNSSRPAAYTSLRASALPRSTCSGDRYAAVPQVRSLLRLTVVAVIARASPKSATLIAPEGCSRTFSGLMSRCTSPASWAAASARSTGSMRAMASRAVSGAS
jgi:hypothetical protein